MNDVHGRSVGRGAWRGLLALALLAGGCTRNPFVTGESDYGRRVAFERLRRVEPLEITRYERPRVESPVSKPGAAPDRFAGMEEVRLGLEECRASALANNLDLRVAMIEPTLAGERVTEEEAKFEAAFTLRTSFRDIDSPTASQLSSAQSQTFTMEPGVRIPLRTGGTASVTLPVATSENNNPFSTLNPSYTSDLQFSLSHQLLRGAGRHVTMAPLRIAAFNRRATEAQTKLEVTRQLAAADRAYWRLSQVRGELGVAQQQYELAVAQQERAQRRVLAGASPEIEVVRAQAGVSQRLEAILVAQNNVLLQQRELKRVINLPGLGVESTAVILPATLPDPVEYVFDREGLMAHAMANRMELLELEMRLATDAVNQAFARNQTLPLVSLDYTYRVNGLGGSAGDSLRTLKGNNFEDWELGLSAEIPLGNEEARSRLRQAILRRIQRLGTKEAREQSIKREVLDAIDTIDVSWQRILAARQSVILNTRAFQAEQRQFEVGASTSTDVLDASARLASSQFDEIRALTQYQIAQVDLAFATGTLLGASRVEWEPAPTGDVKDADPAP